MTCWNSTVVPYIARRKLAAKRFVTQRGSFITIISGTVLIKSIILELKQKIDSPIVLVSNILTHYDIDENSQSVEEYSPIHVFETDKSQTTHVIHINKPVCLTFGEVDEITFQLMNLKKKKINVTFSVHLFYKLN